MARDKNSKKTSDMFKKKKNADFKKVKITPGKKVKRLDDTKTDFRSRKIHINEAVSLQSNATKMLLNKNLKINSRLKISAFEKLNANFEQLNPETMTGETINGLAKYLLEPNEKIREEFVKAVKKCFEGLAERGTNLTPYLQILLIYIKCGLTHINADINLDAKKLFLFVLNRCDKEMDEKLIDVIFSKMKSGMDQLLNRDLELVWLVLKKIQARKDATEHGIQKVFKEIKWSQNSNEIDLFESREPNSSEYFDFSFSKFQQQETIEIEFLDLIDEFLKKEIITRNWNRWCFTKAEARRIRYILEMGLLRKFELPFINFPLDVFLSDEHNLVTGKSITQNKKEVQELKTRLQTLARKMVHV